MMALVTGGASCGKSAYAESLCMESGSNRIYLAAMRPFGDEGAARVRKHRAQRAGKGFITIECFEGLDAVLLDERIVGATILLECLGNVVANELFSAEGSASCRDSERAAEDKLFAQICTLHRGCNRLVIVGNEVGADGICYAFETQAYQRVLGALSCRLAAECDYVVECVAGMPLVLKGEVVA